MIMQCKKCGAEIKEGCLFCYSCGEEVRMVPDYEPELEELELRLSEKQKRKKTIKEIEEQPSFQEAEKKKISVKQIVRWPYFFPTVMLFVAMCTLVAAYSTVLESQAPEAMRENEQEDPGAVPRIQAPEFNLEGGEYGYYLTIELTAGSGAEIYYTTDGTVPDETSCFYSSPIDLSEGVTVIRAVAMDENGNFSEIAEETYTLEFGAPDAPIILPDGGEYREEVYVKILVPDGCTAYYTLDGNSPTESSEIYTGEFLMPSGVTTVNAVLQNQKGAFSEVTSVLYYRINPEEFEEPTE